MFTVDIHVGRDLSEADLAFLRDRLLGVPQVLEVTVGARGTHLTVGLSPNYEALLMVRRLSAQTVRTLRPGAIRRTAPPPAPAPTA